MGFEVDTTVFFSFCLKSKVSGITLLFQGVVLAQQGIFPFLEKKEESVERQTEAVSTDVQGSKAARSPEIQDRASGVPGDPKFSKDAPNPLIDKQLARKLWERRLILDAFSLENPSLASALLAPLLDTMRQVEANKGDGLDLRMSQLVEAHPSLTSMMVTGESEGRSSRGGGGVRGDVGRGEVRFPQEEPVRQKAASEARFNLRMAQLEQLLADQDDHLDTFRR